MALSGLGLIYFAWFSFMGLNYHFHGNLLLPVVIVTVGCVALVYCLVQMCRSKRSRDRRHGLPREVGSALLSIGIVAAASMPFTQFLKIVEDEDRLREAVRTTCAETRSITPAYREYVHERVEAYGRKLQDMGASELNRAIPALYDLPRSRRIGMACESLGRRLLPPSMERVDALRCAWLDVMCDVNVWNISAPRDINAIGKAGRMWVEEYRQIAGDYCVGEEQLGFEVPGFDGSLVAYNRDFAHFTRPYPLALAASLLCFVMMMLPYVLTVRSRNYKS